MSIENKQKHKIKEHPKVTEMKENLAETLPLVSVQDVNPMPTPEQFVKNQNELLNKRAKEQFNPELPLNPPDIDKLLEGQVPNRTLKGVPEQIPPMTTEQLETIEWFDDRFYKIPVLEGFDFYPSVTTVLGIIAKEFLLNWYGDLGTERALFRSKIAKEKGSRIHEAIYKLASGIELHSDYYAQEEWLQIYRYSQWYDAVKPQIIARETTVLSKKLHCAGTLDMVCFIKEGDYDTGYSKPVHIESGYYIGDLKTGKSEDSAYNYQTSAYKLMVEEMQIMKNHIKGTFILYTQSNTKKGWKMILRTGEELNNDLRGFQSALALYELGKQDKPIIRELPKIIKLERKQNE